MPVNALRDAGLIRPGNDYGSQSELIPFFYNRITIPIHDDRGNPIGITARCLPSDQGSDVPKYINTTQTPIYNKGNLLFNYHRAREAARKNHRLVIVEGAMDVIGLAKAGIDEGVAALGTAFTHEQMQLIRRLNVPVTVFMTAIRPDRRQPGNLEMRLWKPGFPLPLFIKAQARTRMSCLFPTVPRRFIKR